MLAAVLAITACTPAELRAYFDRHGIEHPSNRKVKAMATAITAIERAAKKPKTGGATGFDSHVTNVSTRRLGNSWRKGCPVAASSLRLVSVDYWGFDGKVHDGEIIVHHSITDETIGAFRKLYEGKFPIAQMHTAEKYITASQIGRDHTIKPSKLKGSTNNSVGFVCRKVTGGGGWSAHAYGKAIDINPQQNPYVKGKTVLPTNGNTSRKAIAGTLTSGGWAIKAFTSRGFSWGGSFRSLKDYMHFQA